MIITLIVTVNENNYHLSNDDPELRAMLAKLGARWSLLEGEARTSEDRGVARH